MNLTIKHFFPDEHRTEVNFLEAVSDGFQNYCVYKKTRQCRNNELSLLEMFSD